MNFPFCFIPFTFTHLLFPFYRAHFTITHSRTHTLCIFAPLSVHLSVRVDYGLSVPERRPDKHRKKSQKTFSATLHVCVWISHVFVKIISHYKGFNWPLMIRPSPCARLKWYPWAPPLVKHETAHKEMSHSYKHTTRHRNTVTILICIGLAIETRTQTPEVLH